MRIKNLILSIVSLALVFSCAREGGASDPAEREPTFRIVHYSAEVSEAVTTKATVDGGNHYIFEEGDRLYVAGTGENAEKLYGFLHLITGAGATTAHFEGDLYCIENDEEFELTSSTPVSVTLVSSNDQIHLVSGGKITDTEYPDDECAADFAEAVRKFSDFTDSGMFGSRSFTLSQQSSFLIFHVRMKAEEEAPEDRVITAKLYSDVNSISTLLKTADITVSEAGSVPFVLAFKGGIVSLENAFLRLEWKDSEDEDQSKDFGVSPQALAANHYYSVSRSTIEANNEFHIRAKEDGTTKVTFKTTYATGTGEIQYLSYDLGVDDWTPYDGSALSLSKDDVVYFKGTRTNCDCIGATQLFTATDNTGTVNKVCYIAGDITSLLADPTHFADNAFRSAFSNGTCVDEVTTPAEVNWVDIDSADPLILPSFTSAECYREMFRNCSSLTTVPALPATTVSPRCYWNMFRKCNGLTTASGVLPATTLEEDCYRELFRECEYLQSAPRLPAPTLAVRSYRQMFAGCKRLLEVTCLATDISATDCTLNWMNGAKNNSACTFYKASTMPVGSGGWTRGNNGIPSNWTVE